MAGHRPGFAQLSWREIYDRRRAFESRQAMVDSARSAWKLDKRKPPDDDDDDDDERDRRADDGRLLDIRAPSIKARDAYVRDLATQWQRPPSLSINPANKLVEKIDKAEPDRSSGPDGDREALYAERKRQLSEAWKMTSATRYPQEAAVGVGITAVVEPAGSDPQRAVRIEREREATHGGR
jgi:hypothetical protein